MCMKLQETKTLCQEVSSLICTAEDINEEVSAKGCPGCQGAALQHSPSCIAFHKIVTRLGKKLVKLQLQLNGVICYQWIPEGRKFVIDQDAVNHSFVEDEH